MSKIYKLCNLLKQQNISAFLLPNHDEFLNEYLPQHNKRIEWLTGFTGSAATLIITRTECAFFTDGRYVLQAKQELNQNEFNIYYVQNCHPWQWLGNNNINKLWYDPYLHTEKQLEKYRNIKLVEVEKNPIDELWSERPKFIQSKVKLYEQFAGESSRNKCQRLAISVPFFITKPDSICWLLNIRGNDIDHTPILLSYAILYPGGKVDLFLYGKQNIAIGEHVTQYYIDKLPNILLGLLELAIDPDFTPVKFINMLHKTKIRRKHDLCQLAKACKNTVEIEGAKKAHIRDGIAMMEFINWLKQHKCTERSAAEKLFKLRKKQDFFQELSFPTISAFGEHGAIIHYTACDNTEIDGNNFYLIDSGAQYLDGTTDVTRTIPIGNISDEQRHYYTLVLKGHIALANAIFVEGTTGKQLDILARQFLWKANVNYNHGTGHGVGSYLGVHEGPQNTNNDVPLQVGMIISNEPGFYKEGQYGIRIENLMHVVKKGTGYLGFEILTLVPIDISAANLSLMSKEEINWVKNYNSTVNDIIGRLI